MILVIQFSALVNCVNWHERRDLLLNVNTDNDELTYESLLNIPEPNQAHNQIAIDTRMRNKTVCYGAFQFIWLFECAVRVYDHFECNAAIYQRYKFNALCVYVKTKRRMPVELTKMSFLIWWNAFQIRKAIMSKLAMPSEFKKLHCNLAYSDSWIIFCCPFLAFSFLSLLTYRRWIASMHKQRDLKFKKEKKMGTKESKMKWDIGAVHRQWHSIYISFSLLCSGWTTGTVKWALQMRRVDDAFVLILCKMFVVLFRLSIIHHSVRLNMF